MYFFLCIFFIKYVLAFEGYGTYYGERQDNTGGYCGLTNIPKDYITVAVNPQQYGNGERCGACLKGSLKLPEGDFNFKALVNDLYPEGGLGWLDFALNGGGRYPLTWNYTACPQSEIYFLTQGSNPYYAKIKIEGGGMVNSVKVNNATAVLTKDGYWEINDSLGHLGCGPKIDVKFKSKNSIIKCIDGELFGGTCPDIKTLYCKEKIAGAICQNGILHENKIACCPKYCKKCGGYGCHKLNGGEKECCSSGITKYFDRSCTDHSAPCLVKKI